MLPVVCRLLQLLLWKMRFSAAFVSLHPYTHWVQLKIREGFNLHELSEGFATVCPPRSERGGFFIPP